MKVIVFDLGGTLMQYSGMPHSWVCFYRQGFEAVREICRCRISDEDIEQSVQSLSLMNPRFSGREIEYSPEFIFERALAHWNIPVPLQDCINAFWEGLKLRAEIYPDVLPALQRLRRDGYRIAALTDLPNAFPDERFRRDIADLLGCFDLYVSSAVCGYRKPSPRGLCLIAKAFNASVSTFTFVGDEEKDRLTALNAGCHFIRIDRPGNGRKGIASLNRLFELIP